MTLKFHFAADTNRAIVVLVVGAFLLLFSLDNKQHRNVSVGISVYVVLDIHSVAATISVLKIQAGQGLKVI